MRDFQAVDRNTMADHYLTIVQGKPEHIGQVNPLDGPYPGPRVYISRKGRDDLKHSSPPYPTNYYAFDASFEPTTGHKRFNNPPQYFTGYGWIIQRNDVFGVRSADIHTLCPGITCISVNNEWRLFPNVPIRTKSVARKIAIKETRDPNINFGTTIGELPESIQFLRSTWISLVKVVLAIKKGNIAQASKAFRRFRFEQRNKLFGTRAASFKPLGKVTAESYLAYQFGVKPLINDMTYAVEAVQSAMNLSLGKPQTFRGTFTSKLNQTSINGWGIDGDITHIAEVGFTAVPNSAFANSFLGLTNPLATAWELLPLSFVIDWFVSIGDVLDAMNVGVGLDFISGYDTTVTKGDYTLHMERSNPQFVVPHEFKCKTFAMQRKVLIDFPAPGLYAKDNFSLGKATSLLALLRSFSRN